MGKRTSQYDIKVTRNREIQNLTAYQFKVSFLKKKPNNFVLMKGTISKVERPERRNSSICIIDK